MLKLASLSLSSPVVLSPMAGISSYPYRKINRKMGFELAYSEMISARALSYLNKRTMELLKSSDDDRPLGIQLLGKDNRYILKALEKLKEYKFDTLDLNAACPQKKITNNGKGARLLKDPKKLNSLLRCMIKNTSKPVTLKMRLGWDSSKDAVRIALGAQDAGASAIYIHGRTRMQGYNRAVDYRSIAKVKKTLKIPVIACGDILSARLAKKMFDETGVDAVAVARGALGNPWIFKEIHELIENNRFISRPGINEVKSLMKEHLGLCVKFYGEKAGVVKFRKFYIWYTRGFINVRALRTKIAQVTKISQMHSLIKASVPI
ncbi:MAG: tRNA dihydrouridine synthase DusB [Candidatus Omnitrophica bacterium]|nr:tRNA dihydrouridine synthase DusB [Candidatus Omnitrophota bacterium]